MNRKQRRKAKAKLQHLPKSELDALCTQLEIMESEKPHPAPLAQDGALPPVCLATSYAAQATGTLPL